MESLVLKVEVLASLEDVWEAWLDTDNIMKWFASEAHIVPCLEGAYELFFDPENHDHMSTKGCTITQFMPKELLGFSWKGPDQYAELMNEPTPSTQVKVEFLETNGVTRLSLEHMGWGEGEQWAEAREWHRRAWEGVLAQLKSFLSGK
jgi:uncharacterized protein YndB with AHSA1/START domain